MSEAMESVRRAASQSMSMLKGVRTIEPAPAAANEPARAPSPAPAPTAGRPSTAISANTEMKGSITSTDSLEIGGKLEGDVRATSIIVAASGKVKGDLIADVIMVYGHVEGRLQAQDVRLCAGADVMGEIAHGSLGIDTAANFEGSIKRISKAASAAQAPSAS